MNGDRLDPVTLSLTQSRLDFIALRMGQVMTRTAHSPIFSQSHDFSCFITDARGDLVSQADGIPIHTGGGDLVVKAVIAAFVGRIEPGDAFISSDPYVAGGNHLPDWVVTRPVFVDGALAAFVCNRAHQSDIGGGVAGTYNPAATEIFHEGIRLPPLRVVDRGRVLEDIRALLLLNSRCPDLLEGDLEAMLGSTRVGEREMEALARDLAPDYERYIGGVLDYAERRMRSALAELPDGVYRAEEKSDNDCFVERDVWYRVTLTKRGDTLRVDFDGTDPQIKGFKNSSVSNTRSAVYVAVTSFLDATIPRNQGTYRPIEVSAPLGSTLNPRPPAPMTMCTVLPSHEIIHACWMALSQADPSRSCAGWGKICHWNMAGPGPDGTTYVMYHWAGLPAAGAVDGRDGFEQIGPLNSLGKLTVPNCETYEQLYPVHFLRHELRTDAAGPGRFRGGAGVDYAVRVDAPAEYAFRGEGQRTASGFGVLGGGTGAAGRIEADFADGTRFDAPQYGVGHLAPLELRIASPAGGGFGDPATRDPEAVLLDVRNGVVSRAAARDIYRVELDGDGRAVDAAATARLRAAPGEAAP